MKTVPLILGLLLAILILGVIIYLDPICTHWNHFDAMEFRGLHRVLLEAQDGQPIWIPSDQELTPELVQRITGEHPNAPRPAYPWLEHYREETR